MTTLSRPLPLELHEEMHKCLPLANQIYVLVNISSQAFVDINKPRMLRNVQRIKTSLNEYIETLVDEEYGDDITNLDDDDEEEEYDRKETLWFEYTDLEWKPELDALLRFGVWLTSTRELCTIRDRIITGIPKSFVEELLLHLAHSCSPQMMLNQVELNFEEDAVPVPTFIKPLLHRKKQFWKQYWIGCRFLFESVQLETDNGQILHIFEGEFDHYEDDNYGLKLFVMNKMDEQNWFEILIVVDHSKEFILEFEFRRWVTQPMDKNGKYGQQFLEYHGFKQNGNKFGEFNEDHNHRWCAPLNKFSDEISWSANLDFFLRRGAGFSQFRHFEMKPKFILDDQPNYVDFLISYISNTKHPEDFLESIEMKLDCSSSLIEKFWTIFYKGIPEVGISINLDHNRLHILLAKIGNYKSEFILANIPTKGAYLFNVEVKFGKGRLKQIVGIKIQKRKNDGNIVELKCEDPIGLGKKRKATNDNDGEDEKGPTCSANLMKQ